MTGRTLLWHAWGIVLVPLAPVALPVFGAVVVWQARQRRGVLVGRRGTWYWRCWWWYGYHGLYRIDWWRKRRAEARLA